MCTAPGLSGEDTALLIVTGPIVTGDNMTDDYEKRALLPEGFRDKLAPLAAQEARLLLDLVNLFAGHGYERVDPPLVEFEDSLLAGPGAAQAEKMFRLMDPVSKRMMGVRSDMTHQVARIASTRLKGEARPLRLSYGGRVLRVQGSQLEHDRQRSQAGIELIGSASAAAEVEVITVAIDALNHVGISDLSVDLALPGLANALGAEFSVMDAEAALEKLRAIKLDQHGIDLITNLSEIVAAVKLREPDIGLTIDPSEIRGFEYHTGVGVTLFARGSRREIGRGGRYSIRADDGTDEPAVGLTLYTDSLAQVLPATDPAKRIYLPKGTDPAEASALRDDGWQTIQGLESEATMDQSPSEEALRLRCSHIFQAGDIHQL